MVAAVDVTIRPANKGDIPVLQELYHQGDLFHAELLPDVFRHTEEVPPADSLLVHINDDKADFLLAETGGIGFLLFVTWLALLAVGARRMWKSRKGVMGMLGFAGSLTLVAQIVEGFSLDTFALPHLWTMLGLISAALWIDGRSRRSQAVNSASAANPDS